MVSLLGYSTKNSHQIEQQLCILTVCLTVDRGINTDRIVQLSLVQAVLLHHLLLDITTAQNTFEGCSVSGRLEGQVTVPFRCHSRPLGSDEVKAAQAAGQQRADGNRFVLVLPCVPKSRVNEEKGRQSIYCHTTRLTVRITSH